MSILIEPPNIFNWKSTTKKESGCGLRGKIWAKLKTKKLALSMDFFHILHEEYI